jgi:hypothetical protein
MNFSPAGRLGLSLMLSACIMSMQACSHLGSQREPNHAVHGIPNFAIVDPGVYRGGQPDTDGWKYLKSLGVKTVAKELGMAVVDVSGPPSDYTDFYKAPRPEMMRLAVVTLEDENLRPVYVHCLHGQDRTGLAVGIFRVLHDRYSKSDAYKEMLDHHFHPWLLGLSDLWDGFDGKNLP